MKKADIKTFLAMFGTKVDINETSDYVELMMDDHVCISWYGIEYYIPENNMFYTENDSNIVDHLTENNHV